MNKLVLMFVMLLGSIATIQAQSFNFSCATATSAELGLEFDHNQDLEFSAQEPEALVAAGFRRGRARGADGVIYPNVNHYAWTFTYPNLQVARVGVTAQNGGTYELEVFQNVGGSVFTDHTSFAAAFTAAQIAIQAISPAVFEESEMDALSAESFQSNTGNFQLTYGEFGDLNVDVAPFGTGFNVFDDDSGVTTFYNTFAEAMAAALAIANS